MATLNSLMAFLLYSSFLLLVSCIQEKTQASLQSSSHSPDCNRYNGTYLNLTSLRDLLIRQEDTIVFCLIERSKYPLNRQLYVKDKRLNISLLDIFIYNSEAVQSQAGRYLSETENKFSEKASWPPVSSPKCPPVLYHAGACINRNDQILDYYVNTLLPQIAANGDDDWNYVPTEATDLTCLQALSWRIHLGKFVAETKFNQAPKAYTALIKAQNKTGLSEKLTDTNIEDQIIKRVEEKARVFGQDVGTNTSKPFKVKPKIVSDMYLKMVIPRTKDVELGYLLRRLDTKSKCRP
ncbi:hypothetical protein CASFOL_007314 [Castilleja foliolosa]|uniref:chorismate mutase n=1 Tax=Castilleja foliolosa TaxID=1961234 RepID=A0ABD3E9R0_9LAMI